MTDIEAYNKTDVNDLWVYDKLILSKKLGHVCGAAGQIVPKHGWYMVKPIVNLRGLGACSSKQYLTPNNCNIPPGYFWQEYFEGEHLSVDYIAHEFSYSVVGIKENDEFKMWSKVRYSIISCNIVKYFVDKYYYVNVEYIGDKIIEIHLRYNPDFYGTDYKTLEVVYTPDQIKESFVLDEDDADGYAKRRLGFNVL